MNFGNRQQVEKMLGPGRLIQEEGKLSLESRLKSSWIKQKEGVIGQIGEGPGHQIYIQLQRGRRLRR